MIPSTPHRANRTMASGAFTVQGTTRSPAPCARASRAGVSSRYCGRPGAAPLLHHRVRQPGLPAAPGPRAAGGEPGIGQVRPQPTQVARPAPVEGLHGDALGRPGAVRHGRYCFHDALGRQGQGRAIEVGLHLDRPARPAVEAQHRVERRDGGTVGGKLAREPLGRAAAWPQAPHVEHLQLGVGEVAQGQIGCFDPSPRPAHGSGPGTGMHRDSTPPHRRGSSRRRSRNSGPRQPGPPRTRQSCSPETGPARRDARSAPVSRPRQRVSRPRIRSPTSGRCRRGPRGGRSIRTPAAGPR